MPRKSSSTKAVRGSSIGSDKSNKASPTFHPTTASLSLDNKHPAAHGQQDLLDTNEDPSTSTQNNNLDGSNATQTSSHNMSTLLLGCGAQFDEDLGIDGTKDKAEDALNIPTTQSSSSNTHCCTACTRLELFIADDEASPLLCTGIDNMTLNDDKINASQKRMRMKLKVLEREIQGMEGN